MKIKSDKLISLAILLSLSWMMACTPDDANSVKLSEPFGSSSNHSVNIVLGTDVEQLFLSGSVTIVRGPVTIYVAKPNNTRAFSRTFSSSGHFDVNTTITAGVGTWKLGLESGGGEGSVDLSLSY